MPATNPPTGTDADLSLPTFAGLSDQERFNQLSSHLEK